MLPSPGDRRAESLREAGGVGGQDRGVGDLPGFAVGVARPGVFPVAPGLLSFGRSLRGAHVLSPRFRLRVLTVGWRSEPHACHYFRAPLGRLESRSALRVASAAANGLALRTRPVGKSRPAVVRVCVAAPEQAAVAVVGTAVAFIAVAGVLVPADVMELVA